MHEYNEEVRCDIKSHREINGIDQQRTYSLYAQVPDFSYQIERNREISRGWREVKERNKRRETKEGRESGKKEKNKFCNLESRRRKLMSSRSAWITQYSV